MKSGISHVMSIMLEEETKNYSLVTSLQLPLPPVPSKTTPLPPLPAPTTVTTISSAAVGMIAAAFPDLSTKVKLNSILNCKWNPQIYSSDATSLQGIYNESDLPNEHISALVADWYNLSYAPLDDPKSELDSHINMIVLGKHYSVFKCYGK